MGGRHYTEAEEEILRREYPRLGPFGTSRLLPGRDYWSVSNKAHRLGIEAPCHENNHAWRNDRKDKFDSAGVAKILGQDHEPQVKGARIVKFD